MIGVDLSRNRGKERWTDVSVKSRVERAFAWSLCLVIPTI